MLWLSTAFVASSIGGLTTLLFAQDRSSWTLQQGHVVGATAIGCLMIFCLAAALVAVLRQRETAASERDQARTVLENAIDAMADGFVIWDQNDRLVTCNARYRTLRPHRADHGARRELSGGFELRRTERPISGGGVETAAQLEAVTAMGCTQAQGFLLGGPRPLLQAVAAFRDPALPSGWRPDMISA